MRSNKIVPNKKEVFLEKTKCVEINLFVHLTPHASLLPQVLQKKIPNHLSP